METKSGSGGSERAGKSVRTTMGAASHDGHHDTMPEWQRWQIGLDKWVKAPSTVKARAAQSNLSTAAATEIHVRKLMDDLLGGADLRA